ncbi:MAG TPA: lipocalin-like domain-containing protein, partial [Candidatus Acidoferrales bacterium]|nr:lipocalin-like domain-containing protein [Candidatus Acidoferrales bacterium]
MRWLTSLPILFGLVAVSGMPQNQTAAATPIAKRFAGAWRLVSVAGNPPGLPGFYDRPTGMIVYLASGQMAVQIAARADRKPFARFNQGRLSATPEEKAAAFDSYLAYYGTYTVDDQAG